MQSRGHVYWSPLGIKIVKVIPRGSKTLINGGEVQLPGYSWIKSHWTNVFYYQAVFIEKVNKFKELFKCSFVILIVNHQHDFFMIASKWQKKNKSTSERAFEVTGNKNL